MIRQPNILEIPGRSRLDIERNEIPSNPKTPIVQIPFRRGTSCVTTCLEIVGEQPDDFVKINTFIFHFLYSMFVVYEILIPHTLKFEKQSPL